MLKGYLPTQPMKTRSFMVIGFMLILFLLDNLPISKFIDYKIYSNIIKPSFWVGVALIIWAFPRVRPKAPIRLKESVNWWAFNFAVIFIILSVCAGLIDGFGYSPYSHSLSGISLNILLVGSLLIGKEAARSFIVNNFTKEENYFVFILTAIFMTSISFPLSKFAELKGFEGTVKFIAQYYAPELCQNLLATYLAFLGGWLPSLIYMGILQAFHWLSPVLPNLKWITAALIGIMIPVFSLIAMQNVYMKESGLLKKSDQHKESPISWMITSIISIGIVWFSVGVFPIYPSVIATGSMEPMIKPGDMILVEKITKNEDIDRLQKGDVIQFKSENILISHRIIEIIDEGNGKSYCTKGDNNSAADPDPVKPKDVKGKIRYVVPKVGWPTLLIKKQDDVKLEKVVF